MNEGFEFDAKEAHRQGLEEALDYVDRIDGLREEEKIKLKNNIQYPGIQERVLEIKYMIERADDKARQQAGILLESLRSDIRDFSN
jgi:hypothetical protein